MSIQVPPIGMALQQNKTNVEVRGAVSTITSSLLPCLPRVKTFPRTPNLGRQQHPLTTSAVQQTTLHRAKPKRAAQVEIDKPSYPPTSSRHGSINDDRIKKKNARHHAIDRRGDDAARQRRRG